MNIRADLTEPVRLAPDHWTWVDSPQAGVARVMLDRVGDEVAVATSFVRYAPRSRFPGHEHALGEEFLVLQGEFADENGRYPAGTYVRNPPGSKHVPFSEPGCLIWVKLRQFDTADQRQCVASLNTPIPARGLGETPLHVHEDEVVAELVAAAGEAVAFDPADHTREILVMEGVVSDGEASYPAWSWLRVPAGEGLHLEAETPVRLFTKTRPVYRGA